MKHGQIVKGLLKSVKCLLFRVFAWVEALGVNEMGIQLLVVMSKFYWIITCFSVELRSYGNVPKFWERFHEK